MSKKKKCIAGIIGHYVGRPIESKNVKHVCRPNKRSYLSVYYTCLNENEKFRYVFYAPHLKIFGMDCAMREIFLDKKAKFIYQKNGKTILGSNNSIVW